MQLKPLEKWLCTECGELHDDEDDAQDCCRPVVREVHQCPICKEHYGRESDAVECVEECSSKDETLVYMASKEELERQGQERLF